jgi:hypothetical protein
MDTEDRRDTPAREAVAERSNLGRIIAVGTLVLWLATMLLVMGPAAARGLF